VSLGLWAGLPGSLDCSAVTPNLDSMQLPLLALHFLVVSRRAVTKKPAAIVTISGNHSKSDRGVCRAARGPWCSQLAGAYAGGSLSHFDVCRCPPIAASLRFFWIATRLIIRAANRRFVVCGSYNSLSWASLRAQGFKPCCFSLLTLPMSSRSSRSCSTQALPPSPATSRQVGEGSRSEPKTDKAMLRSPLEGL